MGTTTYTPEQQAENRRKWAAALRSGEFKQCRRAMKRDGGYCCLGVACVAVVGAEPKIVPPGMIDNLPEWNESQYRSVRLSLGLTEDGEGRVMQANDRGSSFVAIADMIESDPTLFTTPEGATL